MRFLWFTFDPIITWFAANGWIVALAAALLFAGALFLFLRLKRRKPAWDDPSVDWLIEAFGGLENCHSAACEGNRLRVGLKDLSKANLDIIQEKGGRGLFVAGTTVKLTMTPPPLGFVNRVEDVNGGVRS
jgi:phosphotransferase system IIB component